jgi:hypothetical protein
MPDVGKIVRYILTEPDAAKVNKRRERSGGELVEAGQVLPMMIVRVQSETAVDGKVLLDGDDSLWLTNVELDEDEAPGGWHWPERL